MTNAFGRVQGLDFDDDRKAALREASIKAAIDVIPRAKYEKWKETTYNKYGDAANIIESWGEERGVDILGAAREIDAYIVACFYNDRIDEGEGVAPSTADKELTVISHWYEHIIEHSPNLATTLHPTKCSMIKDLQKRHKMLYQYAPVKKTGFELEHIRELFGDGSLSGVWAWDHTRLAIGIMFFFLCRSIAAAHVVWRGNSSGPIARVDSDVSWNTDKKYGDYMRIDVNRDKTIKAKQESNRFLPCDNGSGVDFSRYVRDYIRHYRVPDGCFLLAVRKHNGSFHQLSLIHI